MWSRVRWRSLRREGGRGRSGPREKFGKFDHTVAGTLADTVYDRDELTGWLHSDERGLIRDRGGEGRTGDLLAGASGGIGDGVHVDTVGADGEQKTALDV